MWIMSTKKMARKRERRKKQLCPDWNRNTTSRWNILLLRRDTTAAHLLFCRQTQFPGTNNLSLPPLHLQSPGRDHELLQVCMVRCVPPTTTRSRAATPGISCVTWISGIRLPAWPGQGKKRKEKARSLANRTGQCLGAAASVSYYQVLWYSV
ncbi:hypothetical protein ASPBRDRAFT_612959 [Aspergillus brasiliensis CBS 101740]|uniref:Uncharacterized protein n=1 Tax=Aspergillus brasiliensis (strain CBS 101740 / IMI 381727 / IBT 21946) TaxID=767769 RepID=A0A1L9UIA1_ASPBC|nr:hypothetical protein ASPBRDRAFT_612959 [Aspergillus brasiliensis CBS 101740]